MTNSFLGGISVWWFVLGEIVLIFGLLVILRTYKPRTLCYKIVAVGSLLRPPSLPEEFTLTYAGEPLSNAHGLDLRIDNWSRRTIRAADFEKPLTISFGPGVTVVDAAIVRVRPVFLVAELENGGDHLTIPPLLLKPGNGLTIQAVLSGYRPPVVSAKIAGVRKIVKWDEFLLWRQRSARYTLGIGVIVLALDTVWMYLSGDISAAVALSLVFTYGCLYLGCERMVMLCERYGPRVIVTPPTDTPPTPSH